MGIGSRHESGAVGVAIVGRYRMVRAALRALLEKARGTHVVAAADDCHDALAQCSEPPDILVVSVDDEADIDALEATGHGAVRPRLIVLGGDEAHCPPKRAMAAGASGFVAKSEPADTLLKAIERVHEGEVWFDRATMAALIAETAGIGPPEPADATERSVASLAPRDREIVRGVTAGLKNRDVAAACGITEAAVRHGLTRIYRALGVTNRLELARLALRATRK